MVLLSSVYLAIEIGRTARLPDVKPWKDDALVPLFCLNLERDLRERAGDGLGEPHGVERRIGGVRVQIVTGEDGYPRMAVGTA